MSDDAEMMVPFYIAANATLRGRVEAAEALAGDLAQAGAKAEVEIDALRARVEAAEQRAEALAADLAQARADRTLMTGLWLGTVTPRVLPAILPTDPGDRERLVAALDAVNLQPSAEACIAAGRAVIARIVAEMGGTAP